MITKTTDDKMAAICPVVNCHTIAKFIKKYYYTNSSLNNQYAYFTYLHFLYHKKPSAVLLDHILMLKK